MSVAFASRVLVSTEAMSSTLPVLVLGIEEENLAAIVSWRLIRKLGSACTLVDQWPASVRAI